MSAAEGVVRVRLFAAAKAAAGVAEVLLEPGTIASISVELIARYPALATVLPACSFLIDGVQPSDPGGVAFIVAGSVLDVLPPFAGG
ncbi:MAG: MoaD/ThiS family protein [Actinomycetota bacterium]|nr:MoaD/ThiS family protein [Actinomycetota bacterium]